MRGQDNNPQTATGQYLKKMAQHGHYAQKLGEASLALTEAYCKADTQHKVRLGAMLAEEVYTVLTDVYGWTNAAADVARQDVLDSFKGAERL